MANHGFQKYPKGTSCPVHLPGSQMNHQYHQNNGEHSSLSNLNQYFIRPNRSFTIMGVTHHFNDITYSEYFSLFCLTRHDANNDLRQGYFWERVVIHGLPSMHVILRNAAHRHLSRLEPVQPSQGELFYL
jgi:hypothetical protein